MDIKEVHKSLYWQVLVQLDMIDCLEIFMFLGIRVIHQKISVMQALNYPINIFSINLNIVVYSVFFIKHL